MSLEVLRLTTHLSRILRGQGTTFQEKQIYNRFWSVFSREMFKRMYASYRNRARKWDDQMPAWKPLAASTVKTKKRKRGRIPPSAHPTWINFDTGKLMASLKAGPASGERYVPVAGQLWKLTPNRLTLGTDVEYAKFVDEKRKLFPRPQVLVRWAKDAAEVALKAIVPLLAKAGKETQSGPFSLKRVASQKGLF